VPVWTPRSPLQRALFPVLGGIVVLAAIFGATWGIAAWISSSDAQTSPRLAPETLTVGGVERVSESIAEDGPILFPGLNTTSGERTLVLDHEGDDPTRGWRVYLAYPADADASCQVSQVEGSRRFIGCDGEELDVADLARAEDACPIVENRERVLLGLSERVCRPATD
jgi:hypothetical protein